MIDEKNPASNTEVEKGQETPPPIDEIFDESQDNNAEPNKTSKDETHVPSKEENSHYAEKRKQKEEEEKIKQARNKGMIEGLGGVNPYTKAPIEDDEDLQIYLLQKKMEEQGLDPVNIADFNKFQKQEKKKEEETFLLQKQKEKEEELKVKTDIDEFNTKHPNIDLNELFNDELFKLIARNNVGLVPLAKIYEDYEAIMGKLEKSKIAFLKREEARKQSAVGTKSEDAEGEIKTNKSFAEMSSEEFATYKKKHGLA